MVAPCRTVKQKFWCLRRYIVNEYRRVLSKQRAELRVTRPPTCGITLDGAWHRPECMSRRDLSIAGRRG